MSMRAHSRLQVRPYKYGKYKRPRSNQAIHIRQASSLTARKAVPVTLPQLKCLEEKQ